jgi:hypothetical protein
MDFFNAYTCASDPPKLFAAQLDDFPQSIMIREDIAEFQTALPEAHSSYFSDWRSRPVSTSGLF